MKWISEHIEQFHEAEEYIDTFILPLIPFDLLGKDAKKKAFQNELMNIYVNEIEQQLKGRLMQFPNYYYVESKDLTDEVQRLNQWIKRNKNEYLEHEILLTFDSRWRKYEKEINGVLLWIPGLSSGDIHSNEIKKMMKDQINEIIKLIREYW